MTRIALLLFALSGTTAVAPPVEIAPPPKPPVVEAMPLWRVAAASEAASNRLEEIVAGIVPSAEERKLVGSIASEETLVNNASASLAKVQLDVEPLSDLADRRRWWQRAAVGLKGWEATLDRAAKANSEQGAEVQAMAATWEATATAAAAEDAPPVITERIVATRGLAATVGKRLRERRDVILALQVRVTHLRGMTDEATLAIDRARALVQQGLFETESAPLSSALFATRRSFSLAGELNASWHRTVSDLREFAAVERYNLLGSLAIFVAFATALLVIRRRQRQGGTASGGETKASALVLSRPFASAALVALVASIWIYVAPPKCFRDLMTMLTLVPFLRLLPGLVPSRLHPSLYGLAALFFLDRLRETLLEHSLLQRLLLFVVALAALAGLAWSQRWGGAARVEWVERWRPAVRVGLALCGAAFAVSLVANLVGNVSLAEVLVQGTLKSAYAAVALYAVVQILGSAAAIVLRSHDAAGIAALWEHGAPFLKRVRLWLRIGAIFVWIYLSLTAIQAWAPTVVAIGAAMRVKFVLGEIDISLGALVAFAITILVSLTLSRVLRAILDDAVLPRVDLPRGVPAAISKTIGYGVVFVGGLMAFLAAGLDMTKVTVLAGALSVGIGFGLQNLVNNFVSGVILLYERPIQVGDVVEAGALLGRVRRIGIRSSTVKTFDGAEVIVPNATFISSEVVNWTLSDRTCRAALSVGVAYGTDPKRATEVLHAAVTAHPDVLASPAPTVLFTGLGDSSLDFSVRFWAPDYDRLIELKSSLLADLYNALGAAGIEIPFPQRDLHIRSVAPGAAGATDAVTGTR